MKERIIAACIAIIAAGSMVAASLFASPADVLHPDGQSYRLPETQAVVMVSQDDDDDAQDDERDKRKTVRGLLRGWLSRLSFPVRAVLITPLYIMGSLLSAVLTALLAAVKPLLTAALGFVLSAALKLAFITALFALLFHAIFPGRKLREFFTKKNMLIIAAVSVILTAADKLAPSFIPQYPLLRAAIAAAIELIALLVIWFVTFGYKKLGGYPVRRIFRSRGWLSLLLVLAASSLLKFGLELLTYGSFWSFLPEVAPFMVLAAIFSVLVWRRSRPKRHNHTPVSASAV